MGPYTEPIGASQQTLSNSGTIYPGPKVPKLPPSLPEGQVE